MGEQNRIGQTIASPICSLLRLSTNWKTVMRSSLVDAPLVVSTDGTAGPYITVTTDQLEPVVKALRVRDIVVEVDDDAVMLNGRPALAVIDLSHGADVDKVQGILDGLAATWRDARVKIKPAPASQNELIVKFSPEESSEVIQRLDAVPPAGWTRRYEIEQRIRKMRIARAGSYCFIKDFESSLGEVAVWLRTRGPGELYVSMILPLRSRESLSMEQYNQILGDFERTFIEPLMNGLKKHVFNYQIRTEPMLEDVLSPDSMTRLKSFSATANKAMLHPLDVQRWRVFIVRTHLEDAVVDLSLLSDWLQGEGWPEEQRASLIDEYKLGRSILSVYDEERVER